MQKKSETKDKAQGEASDSLIDTQKKRVKFSENSKRPQGSEEGSLDSDGDEQKATQEQPKPLRQSVKVMMPPTRYS